MQAEKINDIKYPLALPSWGGEEIDAIRRVIDTGMYSLGPFVKKFETEFSAYTGSKYAVMVNSGSSANLIMVASMFFTKRDPLHRGDEVIVPAVSWATTYSPLQQYGLKIKFVDIDTHTLNYDIGSLKSAITDRTRLIICVNLLGNSNDYNSIKALTTGKNIRIVEDNCESMGGEYAGRKLGTFGLMGSFSTFFSHHMSTMEGGVVVTDDDELYHILLCLRSHGWTRHLPKDNTLCVKSDNQFYESFRFILPGYNVRPIEMMGAIGSEQLRKLPSFIEARRQNAEYFKEVMENDRRFSIQKELGRSSWFGFAVLVADGRLSRDDVVARLEDCGIETRPIVSGNFARKEVVKYFDCETHGTLANADYVDARGFFVGNHHFDIRDKIDYLKETLDTL